MKRFAFSDELAYQPIRVALLVCVLYAQACATTNYTVSLTNPQQHLVEVQITLPEGSAQRDLQLPVWNALYQVRDFAQYVNWVRAKDRSGRSLPVQELNDSRWRIAGAQGGAIVNYQIYVDSFGPFGAQLNPHHAFFNLAQLLMYPVDARNQPDGCAFQPASRGMARRHATRLLNPTESSPPRITIASSILRSRSALSRKTTSTRAARHYRVIIDAESGDYDPSKIVCHAAQNRSCRHHMDERSSL